MVYVVVEEDPNAKMYEEQKSHISNVSKCDTWIIDSGCSHRMTRDTSLINLRIMMVELLTLEIVFSIL